MSFPAAKQYRVFQEVLGPELEAEGFTRKGSRKATYHRKVNEEWYHIVMPELSRSLMRVRVFPSGAAIDPCFDKQFPDRLTFPTVDCELNSRTGIGRPYDAFRNLTEPSLRRSLELMREIFRDKAFAVMRTWTSVEPSLPFITELLPRAFALASLGRVREAEPGLREWRERFAHLDDSDPCTKLIRARIADILDT
jgi:hypothetical protein